MCSANRGDPLGSAQTAFDGNEGLAAASVLEYEVRLLDQMICASYPFKDMDRGDTGIRVIQRLSKGKVAYAGDSQLEFSQ